MEISFEKLNWLLRFCNVFRKLSPTERAFKVGNKNKYNKSDSPEYMINITIILSVLTKTNIDLRAICAGF